MADLNLLARQVVTRDDLAAFVDALVHDLGERPQEWENPTLARYLDAVGAWIRDMSGYFSNRGLPTPEEPTWQLMAEILLAAKVYE